MAFLLGEDDSYITAATYDINGGLQVSLDVDDARADLDGQEEGPDLTDQIAKANS